MKEEIKIKKKWYCIIAWSVEKIQKVKIQQLQRQKTEEWCFNQIV